MNKSIINVNLLKKINSFFKNTNSLKYLDPNIFENIDKYKEIIDISFNDYFLEYIKKLPKLDFENVVKISREVYQSYGKENEFDKIFKKLMNDYSINNGSLNKGDANCIINASEDKILLSGTFYDVVLLCHEIGHKLKYNNSINSAYLMDSFFFETPSILLELAANNHLRDNYGININADKLRKTHILSITKENSIDNDIFSIVINLLKEKKLSVVNLYREFIKNQVIVEYLNRQHSSIENCIDEGISAYSYDIGYILGSYLNYNNNKIENLNMVLKYKDYGITTPFTIEESVIKEMLENKNYKHK